MRVLVTGATGFFGSWVVRQLLVAGHRPRALVRGASAGAGPNLLGDQQGIEVCRGDVLDSASVARAFDGVDATVHAAGLASFRPCDRQGMRALNVDGTRNVLRAAAERGLRAVHVSTVGTLGYTERAQLLDEAHHVTPAQAADHGYVGSKLAAEEIALGLASAGADVVVINPGFMLGPGDRRGSSTRFLRAYLRGLSWFAPSGGTSFADVRRVARASVAALTMGRSGERYALAGLNRTFVELMGLVADLSRRPPVMTAPAVLSLAWARLSEMIAAVTPHPFDELTTASVRYGNSFCFCDCSKAARELGYTPGHIEALVSDTLADLQS
jgi:dihydroflavonol-4-reductase